VTEKPRVRLVALDIDGTLLRSDKTVSPRTRAAVARAQSGGVRVVLATGRRHPSARRVAEELGVELPLIVHNGALVIEEDRLDPVRAASCASCRTWSRRSRARSRSR
jgi:HAD superfamily hydrolase (TIGR01484 family)